MWVPIWFPDAVEKLKQTPGAVAVGARSECVSAARRRIWRFPEHLEKVRSPGARRYRPRESTLAEPPRVGCAASSLRGAASSSWASFCVSERWRGGQVARVESTCLPRAPRVGLRSFGLHGGGQWQRTQGPGTCIHMDRFQERERSLSQVLFEPVRRRLCNAKESLSLGDERVYVRAFMFFGAQVISLNALHGPFISLLSSEVQQNRQPNPPF